MRASTSVVFASGCRCCIPAVSFTYRVHKDIQSFVMRLLYGYKQTDRQADIHSPASVGQAHPNNFLEINWGI